MAFLDKLKETADTAKAKTTSFQRKNNLLKSLALQWIQ